jgi:hypothetical protein
MVKKIAELKLEDIQAVVGGRYSTTLVATSATFVKPSSNTVSLNVKPSLVKSAFI